jgi:hypothetical protein
MRRVDREFEDLAELDSYWLIARVIPPGRHNSLDVADAFHAAHAAYGN